MNSFGGMEGEGLWGLAWMRGSVDPAPISIVGRGPPAARGSIWTSPAANKIIGAESLLRGEDENANLGYYKFNRFMTGLALLSLSL